MRNLWWFLKSGGINKIIIISNMIKYNMIFLNFPVDISCHPKLGPCHPNFNP